MSGMTTAAWIAVAAVAVSAAGTAYSSVAQAEAADEAAAQQRKQAELQNKYADLQNQEAAQQVAASQTEAEIIREKGRRTAAAQAATLAASGVELGGDGSGSALMGETTTLAEKDALLALRTGTDKASLLSGQADISRGQATISGMKADSLEGQATSYLVGGALKATSTAVGAYDKATTAQQPAAKADKLNSMGYTYRGQSYSFLDGLSLTK